MPAQPTREHWLDQRVRGWRSPAARAVTAALAFLTLTGLSIYLLPFSVFNQHALVAHTALGLVFLVPFAAQQFLHVRAYSGFPLTHVKFTGWAALLMTAVCCASGVVLTWQGLFEPRVVPLWRTVHVATTFGLVLFLGPHLGALWLRARREKGETARAPRLALRAHARVVAAVSLGLLAAVGLASLAIRPVALAHEFPDDYDHEAYGDAGPFAPSLATTTDGGALDARTLAGSDSCGTSGCHEEIWREWQPSAHRWASMDPGFQAIQGVMAQQNGPVSTRYCGGCHDPISLFSGTKNIAVEDLTGLHGYQEGVSCLACHGIQQTDVKGNAAYVVAAPQRYVWELREGPLAKRLADFTIRSYPANHVETLSRRMFKTPEFCAACHKQFIDESVNQVGWVQLQNQYDNWRASRWHDAEAPERTIECRECHMPLVDSRDPAAGDVADFNRSADDGKHRSHRFLGANQFVPLLVEAEGAAEHVELVERWLKGELEIPEIADRWREGPAVPIHLQVQADALPGEPVELRVHMVNNKVGHDFPTGPLDIIQAWIELVVTDADGQVVYQSGTMDQRGKIEPGTFMFKAEPVDRYGNLIDRHNLWEMVGVRFKRSLFPGAAEVATFSFDCPGTAAGEERARERVEELVDGQAHRIVVPEGASGELRVVAKLKYRKFDQYLLDFAFGEDSGLTAPVTVMSSAEAVILVRKTE